MGWESFQTELLHSTCQSLQEQMWAKPGFTWPQETLIVVHKTAVISVRGQSTRHAITLCGEGCPTKHANYVSTYLLHNTCKVCLWLLTVQYIMSNNGRHGNEELNLALCLIIASGHGQHFEPTWLDSQNNIKTSLCSSVLQRRERSNAADNKMFY